MENPLYVASVAAEEGGDWESDRTYYAKKELKKLVDGIKYVRPCCTPLLQKPHCTPLYMHRHQPEKPFVQFVFRVTQRLKSLRSHTGHGPLSRCATRDAWIDKLIEIGSLAVPGTWWLSSTPAERKQTYMCYVDNIQYENGQYTFWIALNDAEIDSSKFCTPSPFCTHLFCTPLVHTPVLHTILCTDPYTMLWVDLQKYWDADVPLCMYRERHPPTIDLVSDEESDTPNTSRQDERSEYEVLRDKNIQANEQVLANLGLGSTPVNNPPDENSDYKPSTSDKSEESDEVM